MPGLDSGRGIRYCVAMDIKSAYIQPRIGNKEKNPKLQLLSGFAFSEFFLREYLFVPFHL
jgi:hypothetical protein